MIPSDLPPTGCTATDRALFHIPALGKNAVEPALSLFSAIISHALTAKLYVHIYEHISFF
jgi:hypothetical protein